MSTALPKTTLQIEGMDCSSCALTISKKLEKRGLQNVNVNFATGEASFVLPKAEIITNVISDIHNLGYKVVDQSKEAKWWDIYFSLPGKLIICTVFTVPLILHMFIKFPLLMEPLFQLALSIPVMLIGLFHFGRSAYKSVLALAPNMDVLIAIGSTSAFIYSLVGFIIYKGSHEVHNYLFFETAATIITLVLLGNYIEYKSVRQTTTAIQDLTALRPLKTKKIIRDGLIERIIEVSTSEIQVNDLLLINTGDRIPVDGIVISGSAESDESSLTGESLPVIKKELSAISSGCILVSGTVRMKATAVGENTTLSKIIELVKNAQNDKPEIQRLGDKISNIFVPSVLVISIVTYLLNYFMLGKTIQQSVMNAIAVLVISCPCAMGLATPTAVMVGIGRAAKNGILIKGGNTLEVFAKIKNIVFDKTGTLTTGEFEIKQITGVNKYDIQHLKNIVYSLELQSSHPIAKSIVKELEKTSSKINFLKINEVPGAGIEGTNESNVNYKIGSSKFTGTDVEQTHSLYISENNTLIGFIDIQDKLRDSAANTIQLFNANSVNTLLLSGDTSMKTKVVAQKLSIQNYYGEHTPQQKLDKLDSLKKQGLTAMVGDGINDAPALAHADIGISLSNSTQIAIQSAQVVILSNNDLNKIFEAHALSKATLKTIKQNLFWAFAYNVVAIPIAALGYLSPMIGALSMAFSDVVVIGNSILLKTKKLR